MKINNLYSKKTRRVALTLLLIMIWQSVLAPVTYALTSGPTQPEVMSFGQVGVTDMVDPFTGDFTYNIPLFELPGPNGGYPFNLIYNAGVGMDQEASWVGLGWNLNAGSISRQVRGLPDEFNGDLITSTRSLKANKTFGIGAGVSLELFGLDPQKIGLEGTAGLSIFHNSFKGVGYSIDANIGLDKAIASGKTAGIGLNLSLNSQEGVTTGLSLDASQEFSQGDVYNKSSAGVNLSYNSISGFNPNLAFSSSHSVPSKGKKVTNLTSSSSFSLPLARSVYTPSVGLPMENFNVTAQIKFGGGAFGIFANGYGLGYYNEQRLKDDGVSIGAPAYGYMNEQFRSEPNSLVDNNREKDGVIKPETPNLAIPSHTYDIFSLTGQQVGGSFRAVRNDIGVIGDPEVESTTGGGNLGVDLGPPGHFGANFTFNTASSLSGTWSDGNEFRNSNFFNSLAENSAYEPWYYSTVGNIVVSDYEDSRDAVKVKLIDQKQVSVDLIKENNEIEEGFSPYAQRIVRKQLISSITNKELLDASGNEVLNLFKLDEGIDRSAFKDNHIAGFQVVNTDGLRYSYALPAYNFEHEEVQFSVAKPGDIQERVDGGDGIVDGLPDYKIDHTNKYLDKKEIPEYAYAYLLTSIVGQDYVDVTGDGVTADDLGYWVKFTYSQKATKGSPYKWRMPFLQVNYSPGFNFDTEDDRGYYTYGEKEVWYLERAETRSHIAVFTVSEREDAKGAAFRLQDDNKPANLGKSSYKLDEIILYPRSAPTVPIKRVKFDYTNELCQGIENGSSGKLTLKKLWFEYGSSSRGALNPYIFDYHYDNPDENPPYNMYAKDRWGNYKPYTDYKDNYYFPYVDQNPENRNAVDIQAGAWCLKEIDLPSGGRMLIDYEADDYGYVQSRQAMQMAQMYDPYSDLASLQSEYNLSDEDLKVRFKLEKPIEGAFALPQQKEEVLKYLDAETGQLYFKTNIYLRSGTEPVKEFISGYADIDFDSDMGLEQSLSGTYDYGYFYLKPEDGHHPISIRAWQHLRVNQPELIGFAGKLDDETGSDKIEKWRSLASIIPHLRTVFTGFYTYTDQKGWGRKVVSSTSFIRLRSPDKTKVGGGHRVRQITLKDQWSGDEEGIYGQYYQYTRIDDNGDAISSGVANNEPENGGDENALHYAKKYTESVPLRSNNNLFFEYPVNESYYPGAQVGYEQVEVMSLASAAKLASTGAANIKLSHIDLSDGNSLFPEDVNVKFGVTGKVRHEFYTSREFPVLTDETSIDRKKHKLYIPIFGIGVITEDQLSVSQGYSITTNDMFGKPKMVTYFGQNEDGGISETPISWIKYNYQVKPSVFNKQKVLEVGNQMKYNASTNTLSVVTDEDKANSGTNYKLLGYEQELFADMRQNIDNITEGGLSGNLDIFFALFIPITLPIPLPSVTSINKELRSVVTNRIIRKSGILLSTEAFDGQSITTTKNKLWDAETGQVVLKTVTNNFEAPIYSLDILAYQQYEGMGPSYRNQGLLFSINNVNHYFDEPNVYSSYLDSSVDGVLYNGDEVILLNGDGVAQGKAIYLGKDNELNLFYSDISLSGNYTAKVWRSGRRNILTASAGAIIGLEDPTRPGTNVTYSKTLTVPVNE